MQIPRTTKAYILAKCPCAIVAITLALIILGLVFRLVSQMAADPTPVTSVLAAHRAYPELVFIDILFLALVSTIIISTLRNIRQQRFLSSYSSLLEESSTCILGINEVGVIYYANVLAVQFLGYAKPEDLTGQHVNDIVTSVRSETEAQNAAGNFLAMMRAENGLTCEARVIGSRGLVLSVDMRVRRISTQALDGSVFVMSFSSNAERKNVERLRIRENHLQSRLIELSRSFLEGTDMDKTYQIMLDLFLYATGSEFGFVGHVNQDSPDSEKYVLVGAITNIAWDQATSDLYRPSGMVFRGLNTLWGRVITTQKPVISNNPLTDPRSKGLPPGHPPLTSFLGIPFMAGNNIVGMIGLANNPDGYDERLVKFLEPTINACAQLILANDIRKQSQVLTEKYRTLLNDAPIMYLFVGLEADGFPILDCNASFYETLGAAREQVMGKSILDFVDEQQSRKKFMETLKTDQPMRHLDLCHWTGISGQKIITQCTLVHELDSNGKLIQEKVMLVDMTSYLSARAENRAIIKEFENVVDGVPSPILITDNNGIVTRWNSRLGILTGISPDEAIGRDIRLLNLGITKRELFNDYIEQTLGGLEFQGLSFELEDGKKAVQQLFIHLTPRYTPEGKLGGLVCICEILTRYLNDLTTYYSMQKMEAIGELTGGIAHDFNNLLTIILGNLEYIEQLPEVRKEQETLLAIEDAISAARDGAGLTRNLLAFARRKPLENEKFQLQSAMTAIVRLGARTLGEGVKVQLHASADVTLNMDRSMLESTILNILINARDAMEGEGKIEVHVDVIEYDSVNDTANVHGIAPGRWACIRIIDEGVGMDDMTVAHAVEPFFTTKKEGKGSGLGLSMAYGFLTQCSGYLKIDSKLGKGTAVSLYLPVNQDADVGSLQGKKSLVQSSLSSLQGVRVLVVEDDMRVRNNAVRILQSAGVQLEAVEDAESALNILEKQSFDIVFSDIVMPGKLDGRKLAKLIKMLYPNTKVLLTTGYDKTRVGEDLIPGESLLDKPYSAEQLLGSLRSIHATIAENYN